MDIEKMKRINALARELREQGIVSDTEEAYKQAEKMIEGGLNDSPVSYDEPVQEKAKEAVTQNSGAVKLDAIDIHEVNKRISSVEEQLSVMFTKINEIISEINGLQKKRQDSPIEIREIKEEKKEDRQKEVQASLKDKKVESHPRTGGYKPEDVSIEKMFYFGK